MRNEAFPGRLFVAIIGPLLLMQGGCLEGGVPTLLPLEPVSATVSETLHVSLPVNNPDGIPLTFSFAPSGALGSLNLYAVASVVGTPEGGEFTWTPLASHVGTHQIMFTVASDSGSHSQTLLVTVNPAATAAPIFLAPGSGGTYDLATKSCIKVVIEVKDDDSPEVAIRSRDPLPAGGSLTTTDPKRARFDWCPTSAQSQESQRWTLALEADDLEHPPTDHDYVMVLRVATKGNCAGTPPQVTILSPFQGEVVASPSGYPVSIQIADDNPIKEAPLLYWSTKPPANPTKPDLGLFEQTHFDQDTDGSTTWTATIPPLDLGEGAQESIWFFASVLDNDDVTGTACDHRTDTSVLSFQAAGAASGIKAGVCELCASSLGCVANVCVTSAEGSRCLVDCVMGGPSCANGSCQQVTTVDGGLAYACGGVEEACNLAPTSGLCTNDNYEPNDDPAQGTFLWASPEVSASALGVICPGDEDHYRITADQGQDLGLEVVLGGFQKSQDLDLSMTEGGGSLVGTSAGTTTQESLSYCLPAFESVTLRVYAFNASSQTDYELTAHVETTSCCTNDDGEPDDTFSEGTPLSAWGGEIAGTLCPSDKDMYLVTVAEPSLLSATVAYTVSSGFADLDLEVVDGGGVVLETAWNDGPEEFIETLLPAAGTYGVLVLPWLQGELEYSGQVTVAAGGGSVCATTMDCVAGTVCNSGTCVMNACSVGTDCPAGHGCVKRSGFLDRVCVAPCAGDSACRVQDGERCKNLVEGQFCAIAGGGDTGAACASFEECAGAYGCADWPGGYCAISTCASTSSCPEGTFCMTGDNSGGTLCALSCGPDTVVECRESEGYYCSYTVNVEGDLDQGCMQTFVFDL